MRLERTFGLVVIRAATVHYKTRNCELAPDPAKMVGRVLLPLLIGMLVQEAGASSYPTRGIHTGASRHPPRRLMPLSDEPLLCAAVPFPWMCMACDRRDCHPRGDPRVNHPEHRDEIHVHCPDHPADHPDHSSPSPFT